MQTIPNKCDILSYINVCAYMKAKYSEKYEEICLIGKSKEEQYILFNAFLNRKRILIEKIKPTKNK